MKNFLAATALLSVTSTAAFANTNFPVEIVKDGVVYNCAADLVVVDGVKSRSCIVSGGSSESGGGLLLAFGLGGGLSAGAIIAGIVAAAAAAASSSNDDNNVPTNGTN